MNRIYICIDLKSFYASVECVERGLDPLDTNLVVADQSRTEKTICLAVSPSLKAYKISGRARLFEIIQKTKEINKERKKINNNYKFTSKSYIDSELKKHKNLELDYIIAPPRMSKYIEYSTKIYSIYLKYLSSDDIFVYSIDEVFCDITNYLKMYKLTPIALVTKMIKSIYDGTGITATAGIGTNLFLCKIAMDIVAKHKTPNEFGVRIAELDETTYRKLLWNHTPLTDFWRVGKGYKAKLEMYNINTMGDIAKCSIENEELLYKLFGVNAETLIDHAWGWEPCTIKSIKSYKPQKNSLSTGQVLHCPYDYKKAELIIREMIELLSLDLVKKHLVTDKITLTIGYDINDNYEGDTVIDYYGRIIPKHSHGTANINYKTASTDVLTNKIIELYNRIVKKNVLIKKINITASDLTNEKTAENQLKYEQMNIFFKSEETKIIDDINEKKVQQAIIDIKEKYGKNAILKGMNLENYATTIDRNNQIGGHKA